MSKIRKKIIELRKEIANIPDSVRKKTEGMPMNNDQVKRMIDMESKSIKEELECLVQKRDEQRNKPWYKLVWIIVTAIFISVVSALIAKYIK